MNQLSFGFQQNYQNLDLEGTISYYESQGYMFYQAWTADELEVADRVELPSGDILSYEELISSISKCDSATRGYREMLDAISYFRLVDSEEYDSERHENYPSFKDDEDMQNCQAKLSTSQSLT